LAAEKERCGNQLELSCPNAVKRQRYIYVTHPWTPFSKKMAQEYLALISFENPFFFVKFFSWKSVLRKPEGEV
jgi:hypothetical protein